MEVLELFEKSTKKAAKAHLRNLVAIGKVDGNLDKNEIAIIKGIGLKNGLSLKAVTKILAEVEPITEITGTREEKYEKLYDIVTLVAVDGILDDREMDVCESLAVKMGFSDVIAGVMIRQIFIGVTSGKDKEVLKKGVQTFLTY